MIDRGLQRRDAVDPARVQPGAGGEQDLDELDAVEARREAERAVEIAAALDQQIDAGPVDPEGVTERGPEDVRLRNFAQQRASSADLDMHQLWLCLEEAA